MVLLQLKIVLIMAVIGVSRADYKSLKDHVDCASYLFNVIRETGCGQLEKTKACMNTLISGNPLGPVCEDEEAYPYCSMLSGAVGAPMVGSPFPTLCRTYVRVVACFEQECGPSGNRFKQPDIPGMSVISQSGDSCPKRASMDCIDPVKTVSEVNKDTCISVSEAKTCYIERLNDCSGTTEEQQSVNIILAGLVGHVQQCQNQGFGFTRDPNDICVPNPMDVYVPKAVHDNLAMNPFLDNKAKTKALMEEQCTLVEDTGVKLDKYIRECNVSDHNSYEVGKAIGLLNGPRLRCLQEKYKALEAKSTEMKATFSSENPGCSGVKCQPCHIYTLLAVIWVKTITGLINSNCPTSQNCVQQNN